MHFLSPVHTSFILFSYSFFPSRALPNPSSPLPTSNPQLRPIFYQATPLCLTAPACSDCVADTAGRSVFIGVIGGSPSPPSVVRRSYPLDIPSSHSRDGSAIRGVPPSIRGPASLSVVSFLLHHPLSGAAIRWTSPLPFPPVASQHKSQFASIRGFFSALKRKHQILHIPRTFGLAPAGR